ncbi:MAG: hypothetical protein IJF03_02240 [Lachnospiraceae bacterium]|nr:hypothetical protein [Lachnospiraceae bacterium]
MKVENISIRAYSETEVKENSEKNSKEKKNKNVINGAELNLNANTTEKRIAKERQAIKIKVQQMLSDDVYKQEMVSHLERKEKLKQDVLDTQKEIEAIKNVKDMVQEAYGVEDDSEEQKMLEEIEALREKQKTQGLTKEEQERLNNTENLTDYQKLMLEYDDALDELKKRAEQSDSMAQAHGNAVEGMKQALLKVHPMVDASKQANEIIKEALEEEQQTLIEEMKENYDKKTEEAKKEAEEAKEKNEQLHHTSDETKTEKKMQAILEASTEVDLQNNLKKNNVLLEEDLKGIEVDESV